MPKIKEKVEPGKGSVHGGKVRVSVTQLIKEAEKVTFEQRLEERRKLSQQIPEENASEAERISMKALRQGCV